MNINPIVLSIPIFFLLIGIEILVQHFTKKKLYRLNDALTNISCGITQQVSGVFLKLFGIGIYMLIYENLAVWQIPTTWYTLIILFVAVDFAYYWAHRMSHEINLFWSAHVVHHQSEDYNLSVALRQSSFQVIWTSVFYLPLAVIGFNTIDFALMAALTTLYQFWIHTETIGKLGWLEYVLVTPSHHRVHHGRDPKYIDRNHGGTFIWWDMMFGTFQKEEERPVYGITKPINSWNPVWANFEHLALMWQEMKDVRKFSDKLKYIFYKPGWLPAELGGYRPAPTVNKSRYIKYQTDNSGSVSFYVLFQYAVLLALTSWFLFNLADLSFIEKTGIAIFIALTTVTSGGLFENKIWIRWAEKSRLLMLPILGAYVYIITGSAGAIVVGSVIYFMVSWVWLAIALKNLQNETSI
jgi:sterol desaturase/sphingolipid hydroxylase (fatty acid hydroxylase superfamily)